MTLRHCSECDLVLVFFSCIIPSFLFSALSLSLSLHVEDIAALFILLSPTAFSLSIPFHFPLLLLSNSPKGGEKEQENLFSSQLIYSCELYYYFSNSNPLLDSSKTFFPDWNRLLGYLEQSFNSGIVTSVVVGRVWSLASVVTLTLLALFNYGKLSNFFRQLFPLDWNPAINEYLLYCTLRINCYSMNPPSELRGENQDFSFVMKGGDYRLCLLLIWIALLARSTDTIREKLKERDVPRTTRKKGQTFCLLKERFFPYISHCQTSIYINVIFFSHMKGGLGTGLPVTTTP